MKKETSSKQAFTLIELLVVVLIIGILAAVAVPQYTKAVEKSRVAEAKEILNTIRKNYQLCVLEFGDSDESVCNMYWDFTNHLTVDLPGMWKDPSECYMEASSCIITKDWSYETDAGDGFCAYRLNNGSVDDPPYCLCISYETAAITCYNEEATTCNMLCGGDRCRL